MLKDVRIHLDRDDEQQSAHERVLAQRIMKNLRRNEAAFKAFIPSLVPVVKQAKSQNISVFANKFGELNIVDYGNGRTFYGLHPAQEIRAQYEQKKQNCTYTSFFEAKAELTEPDTLLSLNDLPVYKEVLSQPELPEAIDVLVVLGIGLGEHIRLLIENHAIKHLIIYEPEVQLFQCSVLGMNWHPVLSLAQKKETRIYFQLDSDGNTLVNDINELSGHHQFEGFYLYRHYNQKVFNCLENGLLTTSWNIFSKNGLAAYLQKNRDDTLTAWQPSVPLNDYELLTDTNSKFKQNIKAFEHYFPDIAKEFSDFIPKYWLPVTDKQSNVNVLSRFSLTAWYSTTPNTDAKYNLANFARYPNKDGLVLGYEGQKLKDYLHFQFVKKAQKLFEDTEEKAGELPQTIKSIIVFGIGPQLSLLMDAHNVEKLFICEPNKELFYASLFFLDWSSLLKNIDDNKGRLYINVGDDGTNLFKDLINQFYSVGPYILASTYFYQTYHNDALASTISQLREQLQVVIAMGENFDHARHGIAHTRETIKRRYPLLEKKPKDKLAILDREVPVFIVGNGPSLDASMSAIKEWQHNAIIISCGTALMPLYKNGVVPDFHAEIEQNRSTFDWCSRVGDFEYLKKINLLSCNGIHPDTCDLFNNTYLAFKEGESSTVSALQILGRDNYEELQFAFPTVSNFVINIITLIGFEQLYLFGVDLGFINQKKHHSSQSGYYDAKGEEKYNYQKENNTGLVVPGNFEKFVYTKYEFKVSKIIIERSLAQSNADCFNTSNGAKIVGSVPLPVDYILISSSCEQKRKTLDLLTTEVFRPIESGETYDKQFFAHFDNDILNQELNRFEELVRTPFSKVSDVERLTDKQKEMLLASYTRGQSLLFYYLYGTVNYANSMLSKMMYASLPEKKLLAILNDMRELWKDTLVQIACKITAEPYQFDIVSSFSYERELVYLKQNLANKQFASLLAPIETEKLDILVHKFAKKEALPVISRPTQNTDIIIINDDDDSEASALYATFDSLVVVQSSVQKRLADLQRRYPGHSTVVYLPPALSLPQEATRYLAGEAVLAHDYINLMSTIKAAITGRYAKAIIPKYLAVEQGNAMSSFTESYGKAILKAIGKQTVMIEYPTYWLIPRKDVSFSRLVDSLGNCGVVHKSMPLARHFVLHLVSKDDAERQIREYIPKWWTFGPPKKVST